MVLRRVARMGRRIFAPAKPAAARAEPVPPTADPLAEYVREARLLNAIDRAELSIEGPLVIGGRTTFKKPTRIGAFTTIRGGSIDHCSEIGRYCAFAPQIRVGEPNHPTDWLSVSNFQYSPHRYGWHPAAAGFVRTDPMVRGKHFAGDAVRIGNDVWLGARSTVLRNVTIGNGAIVAAGAIVAKDVPPYAIVGGVPAKLIRYRFDDDTIAALQASLWWRYAPKDLSGIDFSDVHGALTEIARRVAAGMQPYEPEPYVLRAK